MASEIDYTIEVDDLALGLTRPAMVLGVMINVAFANLMLCALAYIYTRTIYVLPIIGLLHLAAMRLSIKEPRFLELWIKKFTLTPPVLNRLYWAGTNSYLTD